MKSIAFKSTPSVITRLTTAALLLVALAACNSGGGGGGGSAPIIGKSTSLKPTELVATGFYKGIDLTWKAAKDATSYTVYYRKDNSFDSTADSTADGVIQNKTGIITTNASITDLSSDTKYYLRVEAIDAKGKTNLSAEIVTATTNLQPPTELKATGVYKGVDLSWKEAKGADSYTVYYHTASFSSTTDSGVKSQADITADNAIITGLDNDKTYYLRVKAINDAGESKLSEQVDATPAAQAPNLRATGVYQAIDLSWDAVTHATGYIVYYHTDKIDSTTVSTAKIITVNNRETTKANITGLTKGETYYLRVVTRYPKGVVSDLSKQVIITVTAKTQAPNLRATGVNRGVDLSWDSITTAASYTVYYHTASFDKTADSGVDSTTDITATKASITGLINGTEYYFRAVTNYSGGVVSDLSKQVAATANLLPPTKLKAIGVNKAVDISWDAVDGATGYKVYYHTTSFSSTTDNGVKSKTGITATNTSITELTNGTEYYLRVKAIDADGESKLSKEVTATPIRLEPPTGINAIGVYQGIELSWDAVTGATSYTVYYRKDNSFDSISDSTADGVIQSETVTAPTTKASITDLTNDKTYYLRVKAIKGNEETELSEQVTATPAAQAPKLRATGAYQAINLSWDAVKYATGYTVYYREDNSFDSITDTGVTSDTTPTNSYNLAGIANGTKYYFRAVTKYPNDQYSGLSAEAFATAELQPPTNLKAIGVNKAVDLSWDAVTGAARYTVYYSDASFDSSTKGVKSKTGITTTNASITDLTNGTLYYLRVEAISADGNTKKLSEEVIATPIRLAAPTWLVVTGIVEGVDLSWDAVKGATSYTVYYRKDVSFDSTSDDGNGVIGSEKVINATSTSITGLTKDTTYYFGVIASNLRGNSALSPIQSAITKLPPPNPSATASIESLAAVDLSWSTIAGITNYEIYYAKQSLADVGGYDHHALAVGGGFKTTKNTSITISDLSADTTYYFVVVADHDGKKAAAKELTADSSYIAELTAGGTHGCVRLNTGRIKCWGNNSKGQLGVGSTDKNKTTATDLSGDLRAKQLSAGDLHSCAIDLESKLHCWGANDVTQLGLKDITLNRTIPTRVEQDNIDSVSLITAGPSSTCAVAKASGDVNNYCWGRQYSVSDGDNKNPSYTSSRLAGRIDITPDVKQFALSQASGCAIDASDDLWCWGWNYYGQVGYGSDNSKGESDPVKLTTLNGSSFATMVDGGYQHSCVVDNDTKMQCWGRNSNGQLGIGSTADKSTSPQYVITSDLTSDHLKNVSKIATGFAHSCALIKDGSADSNTGGKVRCWGENKYGKIGDATEDRLVADTYMPDINNAIDIDAGYQYTCVLLEGKASVKCWGLNNHGQLGNGGTSESATPVAVSGLYESYKYKQE